MVHPRRRAALPSPDTPAAGRVGPRAGGSASRPSLQTLEGIGPVSGCAWRSLAPCIGVSKSTAHCRFMIWSRAGVWGRLHGAVLHRLDDADLAEVSGVVVDLTHVRAEKGADTAASPVDRGKPGSKTHILSDANRLPLGSRRFGRQHPGQRRAEAHGRGSPNEIRSPPQPAPPAATSGSECGPPAKAWSPANDLATADG